MINFLSQSLVVAKYTFLEIFKSKIILNVLFIGMALAIICYVASEFTYGVPQRVALDFGLGTLSLSSNIIAIFLGVTLIAKEIENRTVYMILSRPISRNSFLVGKLLGMMAIQALNLIILGVITLSFYFYSGGKFDSLIPWCFLFSFLESFLVLLLVVLFSLFCNPIMAVFNTIVLIVCGFFINEAQLSLHARMIPALNIFLKFYSWVFPNFYKLNLKEFLLYEQNIPLSYLLKNLSYGVLYSVFLLTLSSALFNRKNLD